MIKNTNQMNFLENAKDLNPIVLDEKIFVYRDLIPDIDNLYRIMKESEKDADGKYFLDTWDQWSMFGTYSYKAKSPEQLAEAEKGRRYEEEEYFTKTVNSAYEMAVADYVQRTNWELPSDAGLSGCSYCKYHKGTDVLKNKLTMQYHTDYIISTRDLPGRKYLITCTMYINDDYNGGEIQFWIDGKTIPWKPKAGDIVIFPSGEPYWHGVKTIADGEKFFIRNFVMFDEEANPEWLANKEKYGEEEWAKMEAERMEYDAPRTMLYIDEETNERISYEEALEKRHFSR